VIGAADFRVQTVGRSCFSDGRCIDVTTWLFPESADKASASFRRAGAMVDYFSELIASFPYDKLAHVQSSTVFGGMENATAIFYDDRRLANGSNIESLVAHETAHQWFGDAVTEAAWPHLWLSEGFATYFGALFFEHADGEAVFRDMMEDSRRQIVASKRNDRPIVDSTERDLFGLINTNNYEKGAWVLHMLRGMLGDETFFDGIRRYYRGHEHGTALTVDLQRAMDAASGRKLDEFFDQWLFHPGYPRLRVSSEWNSGQRTATVVVEQVQSARWPTFRMPLTIELTTAGGLVRREVEVDERSERYTFALDFPPTDVALDPDGWLLKDIAP
jgi:aminopeptidase N